MPMHAVVLLVAVRGIADRVHRLAPYPQYQSQSWATKCGYELVASYAPHQDGYSGALPPPLISVSWVLLLCHPRVCSLLPVTTLPFSCNKAATPLRPPSTIRDACNGEPCSALGLTEMLQLSQRHQLVECQSVSHTGGPRWHQTLCRGRKWNA